MRSNVTIFPASLASQACFLLLKMAQTKITQALLQTEPTFILQVELVKKLVFTRLAQVKMEQFQARSTLKSLTQTEKVK